VPTREDIQNAISAVVDMTHLERWTQIMRTTVIAKMETLDGKPKRAD
jgi:hypothetical protein